MLLGLPGVVAAIVMFVVTLLVLGGALLGMGASISANSAAGVMGSLGGGFLILALIGRLGCRRADRIRHSARHVRWC